MFLYAIKTRDKLTNVKFGVSDNPTARLATLQTGSPVQLELVHAMKCKGELHAFDLESRLHVELSQYRLWGGGTEWFNAGSLKVIKREGEKAADYDRVGKPYKLPACVEFYRGRFRGTPMEVEARVIELVSRGL